MNKPIFIFDLDGTVIDSSHRVPLTQSGNLHLSRYKRESMSKEKIFADTLYPLARFMKLLIKKNCNVWICTAREMTQSDYDFLAIHSIKPKIILSRPIDDKRPDKLLKKNLLNKLFNLKQYRNSKKYMFEDSITVTEELEQHGIKMLSPDFLRLVSK
jgi:FMN phosphatase YigB (HAD superfamily)